MKISSKCNVEKLEIVSIKKDSFVLTKNLEENEILCYTSTRDPTRDGWIKEFIKRK